jgi:hypothetical protein
VLGQRLGEIQEAAELVGPVGIFGAGGVKREQVVGHGDRIAAKGSTNCRRGTAIRPRPAMSACTRMSAACRAASKVAHGLSRAL